MKKNLASNLCINCGNELTLGLAFLGQLCGYSGCDRCRGSFAATSRDSVTPQALPPLATGCHSPTPWGHIQPPLSPHRLVGAKQARQCLGSGASAGVVGGTSGPGCWAQGLLGGLSGDTEYPGDTVSLPVILGLPAGLALPGPGP